MKIRHVNSPAKKRSLRVRSKMNGTVKKPRVTVYRSNRFISAQAVNDEKGVTLASVHSKTLEKKGKEQTKTELALILGEALGKSLKTKKIKEAIFDRGSYRFHGRVKAVAEGLRKQGVKV